MDHKLTTVKLFSQFHKGNVEGNLLVTSQNKATQGGSPRILVSIRYFPTKEKPVLWTQF